MGGRGRTHGARPVHLIIMSEVALQGVGGLTVAVIEAAVEEEQRGYNINVLWTFIREPRSESEDVGCGSTKMCRGSEAGTYVRLIDFVYHSTLCSRVIKKKPTGPPSHLMFTQSSNGARPVHPITSHGARPVHLITSHRARPVHLIIAPMARGQPT